MKLIILYVVVSYYSPLLGGINCYLDTCETTADGTLVADGYGQVMACPSEWEMGTRVWIADVGWRECHDRGGNIKCGVWVELFPGTTTYRPEVCVVDILSLTPIVTDLHNGGVPFRTREAFVLVP